MRAAVAPVLVGILLFASPAAAQPYPQAEAQALALAQETIGLRSVQGPDNRTIDVALCSRVARGRLGGTRIDIVPLTTPLLMRMPGTIRRSGRCSFGAMDGSRPGRDWRGPFHRG